jgi:tRNA-dihydrouridine synthase
MYKGEADWSYIRQVKENPRLHIPVIGNGDIDTPEKALDYKERFGVDGIMIGRASIGNPWIFKEIKHYFRTGEHLPPVNLAERVRVVKQHLQHNLNWKGDKLGVLEMRRHYASYFKGLPEIKSFRSKLVTTDNPNEIFEIIDEIETHYMGIEQLIYA